MEIKNLRLTIVILNLLFFFSKGYSQAPVANFSVSPSPMCASGIYTLVDMSSNSPTAWSYTVISMNIGVPGTQTTNLSTQNPTFAVSVFSTYMCTITLVSTNGSGSSTVVTHTFSILQTPNPSFNPPNPSTCIGGNPVTIQAQVVGGGPGGGPGPITYNWSTGTSGNSITVTPSVTTIYTCVATNTNGCTASRTVAVTIGNPTVQITSVPANICPGTTSTLTVNGSGPNPKTYTWSNTSTGNVITSSVAGVFTATMTNAQGCTGVMSYTLGTSTTLSITTTSTPTAGCVGNTIQINATGASNYTWSTGSTNPGILVNPTVTTTYSVIGAIGTCTGVGTYILQMSHMPTVSIAGNPSSAICSGGSVTLTANGATDYTWTPGGSTTQIVVVTPSVNVTYTARGQNPGCAARNATYNVQVTPSPVMSVGSSTSSTCPGEAVALSVSGASTYVWSTGSNANPIIVYPLSTTIYSVTGTGPTGCTSQATITAIVAPCTGINERSSETNAFTIYPNPSKEVITVTGVNEVQLEILDITGQVVRTFSINAENGNKQTITGLASGIYFIRCSSENKSPIRKIIVE